MATDNDAREQASILDYLKQSPDWCNCSEYPRSAHSHHVDGTHGPPFISVAAIRRRMDEISGFIKGHKPEPDAKDEYEELNRRWQVIAGENVRAAHRFYDDPLFRLGHYKA